MDHGVRRDEECNNRLLEIMGGRVVVETSSHHFFCKKLCSKIKLTIATIFFARKHREETFSHENATKGLIFRTDPFGIQLKFLTQRLRRIQDVRYGVCQGSWSSCAAFLLPAEMVLCPPQNVTYDFHPRGSQLVGDLRITVQFVRHDHACQRRVVGECLPRTEERRLCGQTKKLDQKFYQKRSWEGKHFLGRIGSGSSNNGGPRNPHSCTILSLFERVVYISCPNTIGPFPSLPCECRDILQPDRPKPALSLQATRISGFSTTRKDWIPPTKWRPHLPWQPPRRETR